MIAMAQHILVRTEEESSNLKDKITVENFTEMAKQHSDCNSAQRGGHLQPFGPGAMLPEFDQAVWKAPIKEIVGPVKTVCGYHYILVNERV
jgi:peptidyl-prolyl cis-trans isomerase C